MMDYYILLPDGSLRRTDVETWARRFARDENRRVARDECCGYLVSTVFLGIDHGLGAGPPVLFETMVFGDGSLDEHQERYCTAAEALAGHRRILDAIARGEKEL